MTSARPFPFIETDRLLLREITSADVSPLLEMFRDAEAMRWWGSERPTGVLAAQQLIDTWAGWRSAPNPGTRWGLQLKDGNDLIGTCGLFKWNRNWSSSMISYDLAADHRGAGYMHEALVAVLDHGWIEMNLNRVEALIHPSNAPSIAVADRLGFVTEGHLREAARWDGDFHDLLMMSCLRNDVI